MLTKQAGATLIELTVTLAIATVLFTMAITRAGSFVDAIEVRAAVTEIVSLFSLARHAAISRGAQSVLSIDVATGTVAVRVGAEVVRSGHVGEAHGVVLTTNRSSITYSPIGVGYGAANFSLVVRRNAVVDTIVISRLGRVRY